MHIFTFPEMNYFFWQASVTCSKIFSDKSTTQLSLMPISEQNKQMITFYYHKLIEHKMTCDKKIVCL